MKNGLSSARGMKGHQPSWLGMLRGWLPAVGLLLGLAAFLVLMMPHGGGHIQRDTRHEAKLTERGDSPLPRAHPSIVPITLVQSPDGQPTGRCLDGTPPGYYLSPGTGLGSDSWLVFLEGGAWCGEEKRCWARRETKFGSSTLGRATQKFGGLLSGNARANPDFWNWNRVYVSYCDGASFAGTISASQGTDEMPLYLQGQHIWESVMHNLLLRGMANATQALLAGSSAGALACMLHCDQFAALFPQTATVKCLSDSGFFLDS